MYKWFLIYVFSSVAHNIISTSVVNYGQFNLAVRNLKTCKGPKQKECCVISARMYNTSNLLYDLQILRNVSPDKGKITASANGKPLMRLQMKNPCDHLFVGPLLRFVFHVTPDCIFNKGNYTFNVNLEEIAQKYYGGTFLYGNLTFKSIFYNDDCNFSCTIVDVEVYPKNETTV